MGQPLRRVGAEPLPDHAAERQTAPGDTRQAEAVEERERVAAEPLDRVVPERHARCAVAAQVVAHDTEVVLQIRDLRVPLSVVEPERVREDDNWRRVQAVDAVETRGVAE